MVKAFPLLLAMALALPACAQQPPAAPPRPAPPAGGATVCTEPRPQMCTREYRPVCATLRNGTRRTYGNACSACAEAGVLRHVPGPCP